MGTSEGKLRALSTLRAVIADPSAPRKVGEQAARTNQLIEKDSNNNLSHKKKPALKKIQSLNLPPSRAELFDFRYLLGRSSARIALFEIDPRIDELSSLPAQFWRSSSRLIDANETFYSAYGQPDVAACIGKPFSFFFPYTTEHRALIEHWCADGLVLGHFALQTEDLKGEKKSFSAAMYAVDEQSAVSRFWIVLRDVTPLAQALEAVSKQEQRYRRLLEGSGFFVMRANANGKPTYVSPSLEELVGFPSTEFESNSHLYRSLIHPDDLDAHDQILSSRLRGASRISEAEYRILCRDGTYRWVFERQTRSEPTTDGKSIWFDSLIFDIQERKLLESELRHSQRMEIVGQLAGGVAHDFNNYLTAILGQLRLSLLEIQSGSLTHERLLATEQATLRCAEMTKQLLSLSRRDEIVKKPVCVSLIVTTTASLCSHLMPRNISLSLQLGTEDLYVNGDAGQLQQVLMNLIINARDAISGEGSITVRAGQRKVSIEEPCLGLSAGEYVEIRVIDSGSGIAPQHLSHIFEPFFTTKSAGHGTGLGLSMVYSISRNHEGSVGVTSQCGVGTEMYIVLPLFTHALESLHTTLTTSRTMAIGAVDTHAGNRQSIDNNSLEYDSDEDVMSNSQEVLIVDDEPLVRSVIKASLLGSGYRVAEAVDGVEALAIIKKTPDRFALIIIDQTMPRMGGRELVARIRENGNTVPLLLTTGFSSFDGAPTNSEGMCEVIVKPFDPIDLIGAAFRLCQKRN